MLDDVLRRIDKRLQVVGLTESAAAMKAGLSNSAIRNWRRAVKDGQGKKRGASFKTLEALAPILKTTAAWLLDEVGPEEAQNWCAPSTVIDVPLVSLISAGQLLDQDGIADFSDCRHIPAIDLPEGDWIALKVEGPSMNKISPPDSVIFINRRDKRLVHNACYVIADETGAATYKRYRTDKTPDFHPVSYDEVEPPTLKGTIRVIGRVRRTMLDL